MLFVPPPCSQPPPPDTPEHASALLLFLAAALRQVERECLPGGGRQLVWTGGAGGVTPAKQLLDICLCLNPQTSLQLLLQTAAQGHASQAAPWGYDSSSGGGGRGGGSGGGASSSSSPDGASSGNSKNKDTPGSCSGACDVAEEMPALRDWGQSNLLLGIMEVATALLQPHSPTSSSQSRGGSSSSTGQQAGDSQQGEPLAESASAASAVPAASLPMLLQKVQLAYRQRQQQQEWEQEQQTSAGQQGSAAQPASPGVSELVSYITSMVDQFFEEHLPQNSDMKEGACASHPGPSAPAQLPEPVACSKAAADVAAVCQSWPASCCYAAADIVAWHLAVVAGALALSRLLRDARGWCDADAPSPTAVAELVRDICPVQAALLFAAVEGVYFRVRQDLLFNVKDGHVACTCTACEPEKLPPEDPSKIVAACKADIANKVIRLCSRGSALIAAC